MSAGRRWRSDPAAFLVEFGPSRQNNHYHHRKRIMTDYGHDLLFGTFVTPTNSPAQHAVEQAVVADKAGLDLVTFQDHPYVAKFHDAWTLIAYAAARTERIRLTTNVTNLPLRQPAVLARAVATADLLSGGRIDLGIGAGGF